MKFELTHNNIILTLKHIVSDEERQLLEAYSSAKQFSFGAKKYIEVSYLRLNQFVMSGLWKKMLSIQSKTNIPVIIDGLFDSENHIGLIDNSVTKENLDEWIDSHNFKYEPYWYQFECCYYALKYKFSRCEVATAGGKSFTIFLYCRYLLENHKIEPGLKILVITIRRMLVTQMVNDMYDYQSTEENKLIKCDTVFSGGKKLAESNVVVGTYQTLSNYDKEYFAQFGAIIIDECHQAHITSIKDEIIPKLNPAKCRYRFGLSGTQPLPGTLDDLHLEAYIGPILFRISAAELQDEGTIAQIKVNMIKFIYPYNESKDLYFSKEMQSDKVYEYLPFERQYVQYHTRRCSIIKEIVSRFEGNQIVLVENVDYAKYLVDLFSQTSKKVYLIYSKVNDKERDLIKSEFDKSTDVVLVATYETMSTGVSIKNVHALHFPDGGKSRIRMRQSCGRGLRLHPSKEYLTVFDYSDYFPKPTKSQCEKLNIPQWPGPQINRLFNQGRARKKIYESEKFPIKEIDYKL